MSIFSFFFFSVLFFVRHLFPRGFDVLHVCVDGKQMLTLSRFTSSRRPRRELAVALDCICVEFTPPSNTHIHKHINTHRDTHIHRLSSGPVPLLWQNSGVSPPCSRSLTLSLPLSPCSYLPTSIAVLSCKIGKAAGGFLHRLFALFVLFTTCLCLY